MGKFTILLAAAALLVAVPSARAIEISIACGAGGKERDLCERATKDWSEQTGNTVKLVSSPNSATERLALYQQLLAAGADDIDIFQIDVIWPGIIADHMIDLADYSNGAERAHFPSIIENNTVNGRLIGMPWFTDAGVLYYRKDLLEKHGETPPETWAELAATAKKVQDAERAAGSEKIWGFVWQGKAYEGLTCNALEWIDAFGGGAIVGLDGKVTIDNPQAAAALDAAARWVGEISPPGVLNYAEEEARGVFQSGNAVFMRNWPYAWALANSDDSVIKGKVGVTVLPKGGPDGKNTGVLGGWQLAVSKYSKHPEIATDLVMFLTRAEEQKRRAIEGSYNPTIVSLYRDPEVLAANPFFGELYETFVNAVARPSKVTGAKYNQVSTEFWNSAHAVLSGSKSGAESVKSLQKKLNRIGRRGKW